MESVQLPAAQKNFVLKIMHIIRVGLERNRIVPLTAFYQVPNVKDGDSFLVFHGTSNGVMYTIAEIIRDDARKIGAQAVLTVSEAWKANDKSKESFDETPPSQRADKEDVIYMTLHTSTGVFVATTPILPKGKARTILNVEWTMPKTFEGPLSDLLP